MHTYYVHGHGCSHNLIHGTHLHWTDPYYNYLTLCTASRRSTLLTPYSIVYAAHPLVNPSQEEYQLVCKDFQFELPIQTYTPLVGCTPEEYLAIHRSFDWSQCPYYMLLDKNNYYYKTLYTSVASIISFEDWCSLTLSLGAYTREPWIDSITQEPMPNPHGS